MDLQRIFGSGGVQMHFLNADAPSGPLGSINEFNQHWSTLRFGGPSRLGGAIQSLWSMTLNDSSTFVKPRVFYVFTDGDVILLLSSHVGQFSNKEDQPTDEADDAMVNALRSCAQDLKGRGHSASGRSNFQSE